MISVMYSRGTTGKPKVVPNPPLRAERGVQLACCSGRPPSAGYAPRSPFGADRAAPAG